MPSSSIGVRLSRAGRFIDLRKARERAHVLEGQAVALANIDEVIALIKRLRLLQPKLNRGPRRAGLAAGRRNRDARKSRRCQHPA